MPGKVIQAEWDSSSQLVKIYDETNGQNILHAKHTKLFLVQSYHTDHILHSHQNTTVAPWEKTQKLNDFVL